MRSVLRFPGAHFRLALLLLPFTLAVLTLHLSAQDSDDQDDDDDASGGSFASLMVRYDERGTANTTFNVFGTFENWGGIEAQLEQALHCPNGSLVHPTPDSRLPRYLASRSAVEQARYREYSERMRMKTLQGQCQAGMARTGLLLSTDIPLQHLTEELKRSGVTKLNFDLTFPNSKFSAYTPGMQRPWYPETGKPPSPCNADVCEAIYLIDPSAPSLTQVHLTFGLRGRDVIRAAILPGVFLLTPILICLWMGRAALRDAAIDSTAAWFSYYRILIWCGNGVILIWMMGQTVRHGVELIASYYTAAHTAGGVALDVAIVLLPPWLVFLICILFSYPVYRRVRGEAWTRQEFFMNQLLGIAWQLLPLACFLAAIGMISVSGKASIALFAGVYVSYVGCKWLQAKYSGLRIEPLTRGELRDKVFELAKKAAVEVRQVFIVPAGKSQMANAFASRNHMVMFTDYLLSRLNKREVSAIAAHEIAHIQRKHPTWKLAAFIALIFSSQILYGMLSSFVGFLRHGLEARQAAEGANTAAGLASVVHFADQVLAFPELILILFTLALFLYHLHSQHLEYVADAGSVQLTGDPEAMITSLLKLSRLNQTPVQWDRATGSLLTHPSTLKRVQRIATIGQVPADRFQQLLMDSANPQTYSAEPETWEAGEQFEAARPVDPVVTLQGARTELEIRKWTLRLAVLAPAAAIAWAVSRYHLDHKAAIFPFGGIVCLGLYVAVAEWQSTWFRESLRRRFIARLAGKGIAVEQREWQIVCLSPNAGPRVYALGFTWDTGGLFLGKDRFCYLGDQVQFALKREQVLAMRLAPGVPDWTGAPRVYVDWQAEPGSPVQTWNFLPQDPYAVIRYRRQRSEFSEELERWRTTLAGYPDVPSALQSLSSPHLGEVTSQRLKSVINFGRFFKVAAFSQVLAVVIWIILSLPSLWFVCLVKLLAAVYSFSPFWFYREPDDTRPVVPMPLAVQDELPSGN